MAGAGIGEQGGQYCQIQLPSRVRNLAISWDAWKGPSWSVECVDDQVPSILASYYFSLL